MHVASVRKSSCDSIHTLELAMRTLELAMRTLELAMLTLGAVATSCLLGRNSLHAASHRPRRLVPLHGNPELVHARRGAHGPRSVHDSRRVLDGRRASVLRIPTPSRRAVPAPARRDPPRHPPSALDR